MLSTASLDSWVLCSHKADVFSVVCWHQILSWVDSWPLVCMHFTDWVEGIIANSADWEFGIDTSMHAQSRLNFVTPWQPIRLLCRWDFQGKNTGEDCYALLQGIFSTQGLNLHLLRLLHWQDSLSLSHLIDMYTLLYLSRSPTRTYCKKNFFFNYWSWYAMSNLRACPRGTVVKNLPANEGDPRDLSSNPGSQISPGEGNGNSLQYSSLDNPHGQAHIEPGGLQYIGS